MDALISLNEFIKKIPPLKKTIIITLKMQLFKRI